MPSGQVGGPGWRVVRGPSAGYIYRVGERVEPRPPLGQWWLYYLLTGLAAGAVTLVGVGWCGYWAVRGLVTDTSGGDAFGDLILAAIGIPVLIWAVGMWKDIPPK